MPEITPEHHRKLTESRRTLAGGIHCRHSRLASAKREMRRERGRFEARTRLDEAAHALLPALRRQFLRASDPLEYALRVAAADSMMAKVTQVCDAATTLNAAWREATRGTLWAPEIDRVRTMIAASCSPLYLLGPSTPAVWDCMLVELLSSGRELQVATCDLVHVASREDIGVADQAAVYFQRIPADGYSGRTAMSTINEVVAASDLVIAKGLEWLELENSSAAFDLHVFSADQGFAQRFAISTGASVAIERSWLRAMLSQTL